MAASRVPILLLVALRCHVLRLPTTLLVVVLMASVATQPLRDKVLVGPWLLLLLLLMILISPPPEEI